jgi:hypothetical protein
MKKIFALHMPGRDDQRVVEAIKHDVRKYVKRERRKSLPEGVAFWDFTCRVGCDQASLAVVRLPDISDAIDEVVKTGSVQVYIEILAVPGHHLPRTPELAT